MFKDYDDFKSAIKNCGVPVAEAEFKKSTVHPPYACYFRSNENTISANGKPVITITKMAVELFTEKSDTTSEGVIEEWFAQNEIRAKKSDRAFVTAANYYETIYEFELIFQ